MIDDRTLKLMRVALDPAASDAESATYWEKVRVSLRANGLRVDDLVAAPPAADASPMIVVDAGEPVEFDMRMPWGQFKGETLRDVYLNRPDYLEWVLRSADKATPALKRAIEIVLGS